MKNNAIIVATGLGMAMSFADLSGIAVALPTIGHALGATMTQLHWIVNIYLLAMATVVISVGRMGDQWGHQKTFILGVCVFIFASFLAAESISPVMLICARALQGLGAVCIGVPTPNLVMMCFDKKEQGSKVGTVMSIASFFMVFSPFIAGAICEYLHWSIFFYLNIPIGLCALIALKYANVPKQTFHPDASKWDYKGFLLLAVSLFSLTYGLMNFKPNIQTALLLLIALAGLYALYKVESRVKFPMLDFNLLADRQFLLSSLISFIFQGVFFCSILWMIFIQQYLGFSALHTGLIGAPFGVLILLSAKFSGKLFDKTGAKTPLMFGLSLSLVGFIGLILLLPHYTLAAILIAYACVAFASFFISAPIRTFALQNAESHNKGLTNALLGCCRQIGGTFFLALFTLIQSQVIAYSMKHHHSSHKLAYFHGFTVAMIVATGCLAVTFMLGLRVKTKKAP